MEMKLTAHVLRIEIQLQKSSLRNVFQVQIKAKQVVLFTCIIIFVLCAVSVR